MPENSAVIAEMSFVGIRSDGANQTIWKVMSGFYRGTGNAVKAEMQNLTDSSYYSYWYFMGTHGGLLLISLPMYLAQRHSGPSGGLPDKHGSVRESSSTQL